MTADAGVGLQELCQLNKFFDYLYYKYYLMLVQIKYNYGFSTC